MMLGGGKRQFPDPEEYTHAETSDYQAAAASLHQALAIFGDLAAPAADESFSDASDESSLRRMIMLNYA
jgi:hypothetical protein